MEESEPGRSRLFSFGGFQYSAELTLEGLKDPPPDRLHEEYLKTNPTICNLSFSGKKRKRKEKGNRRKEKRKKGKEKKRKEKRKEGRKNTPVKTHKHTQRHQSQLKRLASRKTSGGEK